MRFTLHSKIVITAIFLIATTVLVNGQHPIEKVMDQRAHAMLAAINSSEKADWIKFVTDNYSQALIDKTMTARIDNGEGATSSTTPTPKTQSEKIEAKAMMLSRLHGDFGGSEISSQKITGDKLDLTLTGKGGTAVITLRFETAKPYLITGFGVEATR